MINLGVGLAFIVFITVFWTAIYGTVDSLPWGMQEPFEQFMLNINILRNLMPWMDELWKFIVYILLFEVLFFTFNSTWTIIKFVRGGS